MYDEEQNPERTDKNIQEDVVYMAVFTEPDDSSGDGEGENENQDTDQDKSEPSEGESNSNSQDRNEQNEEQSNQTTQTDPSNSNNDIIDEETYYRDVLESYYESAMQKLAAGGELTAEEQAFIEQYFGIIS
jgi:hypothetical protein